MLRRELLIAAAAGSLAGCLQAPGGGNGDDGGEPGGSPAESGDPDPSIADRSVETTGSECASGDVDDATIERDEEGVTVTGSLQTGNPCHVAVLDTVEFEDENRLHAVVGAESEGGMCTQCVGRVDYEARIDVEHVDSVSGVTVDHVDGGTFTEE